MRLLVKLFYGVTMILVCRERHVDRQFEATAYRQLPRCSFSAAEIDGHSPRNTGCGRSYRFETSYLTFSIQMLIRIHH